MRQLISTQPFISDIVARPVTPPAGDWSHLVDEPNARPVGNAIAAIAHLLDGDVSLRYIARSDPALRAEFADRLGVRDILYRMRSNQIYSTGLKSQDPDALILFAARLLLNRVADFTNDYWSLLFALRQSRPQAELDRLMRRTAASLMSDTTDRLGANTSPSYVVWFYAVSKTDDSIAEFAETEGLDLSPLFTDAAIADRFLWTGEPTPYDVTKSIPLFGYLAPHARKP